MSPASDDGPPHWFEELADHMGAAYLRYSFTQGTVREVDELVATLGIAPGDRVLDVGCGPGRHVHELARRGFIVTGLDISAAFVDVGRELASTEGLDRATFVRGDARAMDFDAEFDAVVSLCQGAFGLGGPGPFTGDPQNLDSDHAVLDGIRRAVRPGGHAAVTAFSSYFQVRWLEEGDTFDAATGVNHERTEVLDGDGVARPADLWTTCYTPRELRMLAERAGLSVVDLRSVTPGDFSPRRCSVEEHEFMAVLRRP